MDPLLSSSKQQASFKSEMAKLQPRSSAIGRYLWLAEAAKIGEETTILRSRKYATTAVKLLNRFVSGLGTNMRKAVHPSGGMGGVSGSNTMVMLFVMLFVLFVLFLTPDSSVVLILRTFLRCYKVSHPGLHHTFGRLGTTKKKLSYLYICMAKFCLFCQTR